VQICIKRLPTGLTPDSPAQAQQQHAMAITLVMEAGDMEAFVRWAELQLPASARADLCAVLLPMPVFHVTSLWPPQVLMPPPSATFRTALLWLPADFLLPPPTSTFLLTPGHMPTSSDHPTSSGHCRSRSLQSDA